MTDVPVAPQPSTRRRTRFRSWWRAALALLFSLACLGSIALVVLADQTSLVGLAYLGAVNSGNAGAAELLGDHFSEDKAQNQQLYAQDIQRDIGWLRGAEVTGVSTTREQTLSGQWATVLRFKWRAAGTSAPWQDATLRVKTDRWLMLTYVRAVEVVEP